MLTPISWGDNPQQPYARSDVYLPDQLIAGRAPISAQGLLASGSAVVYRGTVLGKVGFGTQVAAIGKATATQTIVVAALPTATTVGEAVTSFDTLTLNGTVIAFQTPQYDQQPQQGTGTAAAPYIVFIGPPTFPSTGAPASTTVTTAMVAQALQAFLNGPVAQADAQLSTLARTTLSASTLTLTYYLPGTAGNSFTLATSNSSAFTLGNTTLLSGAANTGTGGATAISLGVQAKSGLYTAVGTSATAFNVFDPQGLMIGQGTLGTAFTSQEINFTWASGGSPAAGDTLGIFVNTSTAGTWKVSLPSATDGSEVPGAILADYADPTGGSNVFVGLYVWGEFNAQAILYDPSWNWLALVSALAAKSLYVKTPVSATDPN